MPETLLQLIDHAVLQPTQTEADVAAACQLCREVGTASICVKPSQVEVAARWLASSPVQVSTVVGFPHGGVTTSTKVAEAVEACQAGATELDMVIDLGWALAGELDRVEAEIAAIVNAGRSRGALVKVILETGLLPHDELKRELCRASERAGAAFVKTSTGFGLAKHADGHLVATGATEHDVRLMRETCPPHLGVKASGGIRNLADAERMIVAGATRLGTSATAQIARELAQQGNYSREHTATAPPGADY